MSPLLARLLLVAVLGAFVAVRARYRRTYKPGERAARETGREKALTANVLLTQAVPAMLWIGTPWLAFADLPLPAWARWSGLLACAAGLLLLQQTHAALGANFSPRLDLRAEHTLVQNGPYRWVRHPMYSSGFFLSVGYGLLSANWLLGAAPLSAIVLLVIVRIPDEEAMMAERFGEAWQAHVARTGRLFPRLWRSRP